MLYWGCVHIFWCCEPLEALNSFSFGWGNKSPSFRIRVYSLLLGKCLAGMWPANSCNHLVHPSNLKSLPILVFSPVVNPYVVSWHIPSLNHKAGWASVLRVAFWHSACREGGSELSSRNSSWGCQTGSSHAAVAPSTPRGRRSDPASV